MRSIKWLIPVLAAGTTLAAQSVGDLNGLTSVAAKYVAHGLGASHDRSTLELCKIKGDNGGDTAHLMTRSTDVMHWTFLYSLQTHRPDGQEGTQDGTLPTFNSLTVQSKRGIFGDFKYSPAKVLDSKSVEFAWIAVSLDDAIRQLNYNGYVRGFSTVTLTRPANPNLPDEYVYVFDCPWERARVALSTQSGALTWVAHY